MSFKTTYILFGSLLGLLAILLLTTLGSKTGDTSAFVIPSINEQEVKAKDIDYVEIDRRSPKEEKLAFVRTPHGWRLEKPNVRADTVAVEGLIDQVIRASKEDRAADLTNNLKQYGLDNPTAVITLRKGADKVWKLNVGEQSAGDANSALVYVNSSDLPKEVMAMRRISIADAYKNVTDFRARDLLSEGAFNFQDLVSWLKLQADKRDPVILVKDDKGKWRFEKPPYGEADEGGDFAPGVGREEQKQTGVRGLLSELGGLRVESDADFIADDVTDMAKYGLEEGKPVWLRVEIKRRATAIPGGGEEANRAVEAALLVGNKVDDKSDKRYARLENEKSVVALSVKKLQPIDEAATKPDELRNRDLVQLDTTKADAIDIQNLTGVIHLRRSGTPETWKLYPDKGKPNEADFSAVQDLMKELNAKRQIKDFPDPAKAADYGFDKPTAVASVWVEGVQKEEKKDEAKDEKKEEKKDDKKDAKPEAKKEEKKDGSELPKLKSDKPTVKLTFGRNDRGVVYVSREREGEKTIATVPEALLKRLDQGPLAYRDKTLPSFSETADVARLTLTRDGKTFVLEKEKKDGQTAWKVKEPKDLAGCNADAKTIDRIIGELRRLRPEKLVAEKPADLDRYGLKQPEAKATVTIQKDDKKTEDWVYLIGKEGDGGRFAKLGDGDLVFVTAPRDLDAILKGELQDPTVFKFDANKVQSAKFSGWRNLGEGTRTLELERSANKVWTAKTPPDFGVDLNQVDAFVKGLSDLAAERFVVRNAAALKPEYKLGPKEESLLIEIKVEGEKAPLTLTLGGVDAKEHAYYAQSSTLPKDVFLLPQSRFETMLNAGPKYFSQAAEKK